jgi:glycerol uptake facilitator-like aquaporin
MFMVVQIAGGLCGAILAHLMFEMPILQLSQNARTGGAQWLSEFVATLGLLTVIFGGLRWRPDTIPALVGLYITAAYWFTASTSFANPAVTIARSFTDSFSGIFPAHAPGFILAQLAAAIIAPVVIGWMFADPE